MTGPLPSSPYLAAVERIAALSRELALAAAGGDWERVERLLAERQAAMDQAGAVGPSSGLLGPEEQDRLRRLLEEAAEQTAQAAAHLTRAMAGLQQELAELHRVSDVMRMYAQAVRPGGPVLPDTRGR